MMKQNVILFALLYILVTVFLVTPVSGGLSVTNGTKITSPYGNTTAVITITGSSIPAGGNITIDVTSLNQFTESETFTDANVEVSSNASATWTRKVSDDGYTVTLTSTGGDTGIGKTINVTFTGAGGNRWSSDTYLTFGDTSLDLTITRYDTGNSTDTGEPADSPLHFMIDTGGLAITDGEKVTSPYGNTSALITILDSGVPVPGGSTITVDVSGLKRFVVGGKLTDANVEVSSVASSATWNGVVDGEGNTLTLTSTGDTNTGDSITVNFTGAAGGNSAWVADSGGNQTVSLAVTRTDTSQQQYINFMIETTPPSGSLSIADGAKITLTNGSTSPTITITGSGIAQDGTIIIDVSGLNPYVANGTVTDANVEINDTAAIAHWTRAVAGNILTLTSTGGNTAIGENVTITFTGAGGNPWKSNTQGIQTIPLTVIRTDTGRTGMFSFVIETSPLPSLLVVANFTASPIADMAPLAVTFTDTSLGNPTSWSWDFGDGSTSTLQNPDHIYPNVGIYTVSLNATNTYGSDTKTQGNYIRVLGGAVREAHTSIPGLTIDNCGGVQMVTVNTSVLPAALVPNNFVLEIQPPVESGFKHITLNTINRQGFAHEGNLIFGYPTSVHLVSEEIAPSSGFSTDIGTNSSFNYSIDLPAYPCNAILSTKIWGGVIPEYDIKLRRIVDGNNAGVVDTAYTAKITKTNFPSDARVKLHMSVNSSWNPSLRGGPGMMFIWRIADNGNSGQILPTSNLYSDPVNNLNYYEAESPLGLSTFGLSSFTGNNNPFQLIIFTLETVVNPGNPSNGQGNSQGEGSGGSSGGSSTTQTLSATPAPADPGKTAKIYANTNGVITQAMSLQSTDSLATVNIGTGIVAKDAEGKPLSSISIKSIPAENLPGSPPGGSFSFAGRAYELQPDGATFSPGISISFTAPNAQFGQELLVKIYDNATKIWQDVPTSTNPQTGIITADISHFCCLALFAKSVTTEPVYANTPVPTQIVPKAVALPPSAMTTFVGMILVIVDLIAKNVIIFAGIILVAIAIFLYGRKRRRDRLMELT